MAFPTDKRSEAVKPETVAWLPRAKVRGKGGDLLVVVLSSAVFIMLGLAAMIVRFSPSDSTNAVAAPQQAGANSQAASPKGAPVEIVRSQNEIARSQDERRSVSAVGSNPPASSVQPIAQQASRLPAEALAPAPLAREPAIIAAAPIAAQPPAIAFAPEPPPVAPLVEAAPEPILEQVARPVSQRPEPQIPKPAPKVEATKPEVRSPEPVRTQVARAEPPAQSSLRRGGEGATWAIYFDRFPDQRAAAAQINALQGKYGPYLGGKRLTYTRKGESWLMRASGLTEEEASQVCEKVRNAGSACSIGGR